MAELTYLVSALATGVLLVGVWALVSNARNWKTYTPSTDGQGEGTLSAVTDSPVAWIATFLLSVLVVAGGAVLLVSGVGSIALVGGVFGLLIALYLLWGVYHSVRARGLPSAMAVMVSAVFLGSLTLVAITVKLLVSP